MSNSKQRRHKARRLKFTVECPTLPWPDDDHNYDEDEEYSKIDMWCAKNFDREDWGIVIDQSDDWSYDTKVTYRFAKEKDAIWFKLRWS